MIQQKPIKTMKLSSYNGFRHQIINTYCYRFEELPKTCKKYQYCFSQARKLTTIGLIQHDSYTPSID